VRVGHELALPGQLVVLAESLGDPAGAVGPVSYTHLDVYKRQEISSMPASCYLEMTRLVRAGPPLSQPEYVASSLAESREGAVGE